MTEPLHIITSGSHNPVIPSIYQIEVCGRCNFSCDFCQTGVEHGGEVSRDSFIDTDLVRTMVDRGDLAGSYYVELQHRGEPLLHKQIGTIIDLLSPHVFLGLSTNASFLHKRIDECLRLHYLTISIDGGKKETYEELRKGGNWERLVENIDTLLEARGDSPTPHIDLQMLEFYGRATEDELIRKLAEERGWDVTVRTLQDCFLAVNHPGTFKVQTSELCMTPFVEVSVQEDGDVVACCRVFNKEVVYGNLNKNSLQEIWTNNPVIEEFRWQHRTNEGLPFMCDTCYQRSPNHLHAKLYRNAMAEILRRQEGRKSAKEVGVWKNTGIEEMRLQS